MALSLTDINVGTVAGDGTGDTARVAFQAVNSNNTAVEDAVNAWTGTLFVQTVANQDYVLSYDMPFAGTVTKVRTKTQSGTCTVTGKINTTALGGTANSASSTAQEQTHSSSNTFAKGDTLKVTISSNSSALSLEIAFYGAQT